MQNQRKGSSSTTIWVIIIIVVLLGVMGSCSSRNYERDEKSAFNNQMHKDPSKWSDEEKSRYNGFIDWLDKN